MSGYFGAPNDFRNYLMHYGVKGMKWGRRKNPMDYEMGKVRPSRWPLGKKDDQHDSYDPRDKVGINKNVKDRYGKTVSGYDPRDRIQSQRLAKDGRIRNDKDDSFYRQKHDARDKRRQGKVGEHKNSIQVFAGSHRQAIQSLLRRETARQEIQRNETHKRKSGMNPMRNRKRRNS